MVIYFSRCDIGIHLSYTDIFVAFSDVCLSYFGTIGTSHTICSAIRHTVYNKMDGGVLFPNKEENKTSCHFEFDISRNPLTTDLEAVEIGGLLSFFLLISLSYFFSFSQYSGHAWLRSKGMS